MEKLYNIIAIVGMCGLLVCGVWSFGLAIKGTFELLKDRRERRQAKPEPRVHESPLDSVQSAEPLTQTRWQR